MNETNKSENQGKGVSGILARLKSDRQTAMAAAALLVGLICLIYGISAGVSLHHWRTTYDGLPEEGGFPMSSYDQDAYYYDEYYFLNYDDGSTTALRGVDVSAHQGEIDWARAKAAGVQFAMIRVGYRSYADGTIHPDETFVDNIREAEKNGIRIGAYFFSQATTVEEAIEEAEYVVRKVRGYDVAMPIAFDMEPVTAEDRIAGLTMREKTEIADAFCTVVEKYGYDSLIYGNQYWIYENLNLSLLSGRNLWYAQYKATTDFPYDYAMWQYTDGGIVDGIENGTDLNIFYVKQQKEAD